MGNERELSKDNELEKILIYYRTRKEPSGDAEDLITALQSYMRRKVLKGRIESSEKMLELWTINGCPTASGCKYINELEQQLKSEKADE